MDFMELAQQRYSCRKFSDRSVEPEKLEQLMKAAALAPTAINTQSFKLWHLASEQAKAVLREHCGYTFGAPEFILVGSKHGGSWTREVDQKNFADVDAAIAATHLMLEAQQLGLATTWVGCFDAPALQQQFPQMQDYELIALFPIGYAAETAHPSAQHTTKKPLGQLVEVL